MRRALSYEQFICEVLFRRIESLKLPEGLRSLPAGKGTKHNVIGNPDRAPQEHLAACLPPCKAGFPPEGKLHWLARPATSTRNLPKTKPGRGTNRSVI